MQVNTNVLAQKAMLADISLSAWQARKTDKKISQEVSTAHGIRSDMGSYRKSLFDTSGANPYKTVMSILSKARQDHYRRTLPYEDKGPRILPSVGYVEYEQEYRDNLAAFQVALDDFIPAYPAMVQAARVALNGGWKAEDYPDAGQISDKFGMSLQIRPVPASGNFIAECGALEQERIKQEIEASVSAKFTEAMKDPYRRIQENVSHMLGKLQSFSVDAEGKQTVKLYDSMVENIAGLADIIPSLNISGDGVLNDFADRIKLELCQLDRDTLKNSDQARLVVAGRAERILEDIQAYI